MGDGGWREGAHMPVASMRNNLEAKCNKQKRADEATDHDGAKVGRGVVRGSIQFGRSRGGTLSSFASLPSTHRLSRNLPSGGR